MTRKDYIKLAAYLSEALDDIIEPGAPLLDSDVGKQMAGFAAAVGGVASALKSDNGRFDADKFIDAVMK